MGTNVVSGTARAVVVATGADTYFGSLARHITARVPFLQSWAALPLTLLTAVIMAVGLAIPFTPVGAGVGLVPLPAGYFPWLAATLVSYCGLTQLLKVWYIRKFGTWL
jgi:Mg2+-importing ATPase